MAKVLFIPVSIVGGLIAGLVGKKIFETAWGLIDKEEPPESEHREVSWLKLIAALAAEGAIFRATRGAVDHVASTVDLNSKDLTHCLQLLSGK